MPVLCNPNLGCSPQTHHSLNKKKKIKKKIPSRVGLSRQSQPYCSTTLADLNTCSSLRQFLSVWMAKTSSEELLSRCFNLIGVDLALPINLCHKKQFNRHPRRGKSALQTDWDTSSFWRSLRSDWLPETSRWVHISNHMAHYQLISHGGQCSYSLPAGSSVHSHF